MTNIKFDWVMVSEKVDGNKRFVDIMATGAKKVITRRFYKADDKNVFRYKNQDFTFEVEGNKVYNIKPFIIYHAQAEGIKGVKVAAATQEATEQPSNHSNHNTQQVQHGQYNTILTCVDNNIPVYLYGPAGSGKNHTLQQVAEQLNLDFYFTNSVQQEYKITGFIDAGGNYHETEFYKAFTNGGLFFLDEIDASIPEVLVLLNAAIANKYFEFPNGKVDAHKDFRVVAAGNTVGDGGDEQYSGRLQLDQATLDRFVLIEFDYDINVEMAISNNNQELVEFIRSLRFQAEHNGVRATFSYRALITVTKLEGKLSLVEIIKIAVVKGLDKDTLLTFKPGNSKYGLALKEIQEVA